MDAPMIDEHLENIDHRLTRLEQILPTLATKDELKTLATKAELREEGETSRRHMTMLIEKQDHKIELLAEYVLCLMPKPPKE